MATDKKMFRLDDDGVPEWVVARSREEAFEFYKGLVGEGTIEDIYKGYLDNNGLTDSDAARQEFMEYYVEEEIPDKKFTLHLDDPDRTVVTKTISEFLTDVTEVPILFASSEY